MRLRKGYNILMEGMSGKIDGKIYFTRNGDTFVRRAPKNGYNKVPTEKQAIARARFIEAHHFGQVVINDPLLKALYAKKTGKGSAYSKAVSEYLNR